MEENKKKETAEETEPVETEEVSEEILEEPEVAAEESDPEADMAKQIEELTAELTRAKNDVARAYADTDNTRKRLIRDADLAKKYRFQSAALELLPVLDNINMALSAVPNNEEAKNFAKGFEMIRTQLENVLTSEGVSEIEALNQPFDHNTMSALMTEAAEGVEPGTVIEVLQKGYKLKDRLLRPALVKVSE